MEEQSFQVRDYQPEDFAEIYQILQDSFPAEECPDLKQISLIMQRPMLKIKIFEKLAGDLIGLYIGHDFSDFFFCDYLVIHQKYRNRGYGGQFLQYMIQNFQKPIILECEPPDFSDIALRRLHFYQRTGFVLLTDHYQMPSFSSEDTPMPMYLMAANLSDTEICLLDLIEKIYRNVYPHLIYRDQNKGLLSSV